jgi:hypothetical protein
LAVAAAQYAALLTRRVGGLLRLDLFQHADSRLLSTIAPGCTVWILPLMDATIPPFARLRSDRLSR